MRLIRAWYALDSVGAYQMTASQARVEPASAVRTITPVTTVALLQLPLSGSIGRTS